MGPTGSSREIWSDPHSDFFVIFINKRRIRAGSVDTVRGGGTGKKCGAASWRLTERSKKKRLILKDVFFGAGQFLGNNGAMQNRLCCLIDKI